MADTMQFDLVSPERRVASLEVTSVQIPGSDGDMTAMPGHAPLITTLRPGILRVESTGATQEYVVTGGFAEIGENLSVLAERALPREEMTQETFDAILEEARAALNNAKEVSVNEPGRIDDAAKLLSDMVAIGVDIGMNANN
jgi:F-type H+-transporting ATPase subunit epsilon